MQKLPYQDWVPSAARVTVSGLGSLSCGSYPIGTGFPQLQELSGSFSCGSYHINMGTGFPQLQELPYRD